jgi:hypothetical protein
VRKSWNKKLVTTLHEAVQYFQENILTTRCSIFFGQFIVTQLVKQYPAFFMESGGSVPCLQKPATRLYPEPAESSSPHRSLLSKVYNVTIPSTPTSSQRSLPLGPQPKPCKHLSPPPKHATCLLHLITLTILGEEYRL